LPGCLSNENKEAARVLSLAAGANTALIIRRRTMSLARESLQPVEAAEQYLGDTHPLVGQLGTTEGLVELSTAAGALAFDRVDSVGALERFLVSYRERLLAPCELPAIRRAFEHASRGESRELAALDRELAFAPLLRDFASASQRVGRGQLRRLRPLRDQRVVQRYLRAVEAGEAHGWHTVVYGLTLAVYSLPLRQGLMGYAQQTLRGFISSASVPLHLSETAAIELYQRACEGLPGEVEQTLVSRTIGGAARSAD
jgi:urease accessory protein UreF